MKPYQSNPAAYARRRLACVAALALGVHAWAGAPPAVATARAYKGPEGQRVELVTLQPPSAGRALVRFAGTGSPHDGLVLDATVRDEARSVRSVVTRFRGGDYVLLRLEAGTGRANFPEVSPFPVRYDEADAGQPDASALFAAQEPQRASGALALFAKREFPHLTAKYDAKAAAALAKLNERCGSKATFAFRWADFTDEDMEEHDVFALCQPLFPTLESRCAVAKGHATLVCARGDALRLTRDAGTLVFTTTAKGKAEGGAFLAAQLGK